MRVPVWLTLGIAGLVMIFGVYRLRLAMKAGAQSSDQPRKGLYAMGKRAHLTIGILYLLLGGALVATSFGWKPFASNEQPAADNTPPTATPIKR
jgi:hypothetical protein